MISTAAAPAHSATVKTVAAQSQPESRILPRISMLKRIGWEKFLPSPCPLWVKSKHVQRKRSCPLYPRKRDLCSA
jgi:hypothetical protein